MSQELKRSTVTAPEVLAGWKKAEREARWAVAKQKRYAKNKAKKIASGGKAGKLIRKEELKSQQELKAIKQEAERKARMIAQAEWEVESRRIHARELVEGRKQALVNVDFLQKSVQVEENIGRMMKLSSNQKMSEYVNAVRFFLQRYATKNIAKKSMPDRYIHEHHFFPRSCGGKDEAGNRVYVTASEHFYLHELLVHALPEGSTSQSKMEYAFQCMSEQGTLSSTQYEVKFWETHHNGRSISMASKHLLVERS